jgi:hypothetical protein
MLIIRGDVRSTVLLRQCSAEYIGSKGIQAGGQHPRKVIKTCSQRLSMSPRHPVSRHDFR